MSAAPSVLIKGGTVVDPSQGLHARRDVLISQGRIDAIADAISPQRSARVIDASGLIVAPGFVELHCHLREPGGSASETIESGSAAAAAGGYTTVFPMPNTNPVCDSPVVVKFLLGRAAEVRRARVVPIAAVTREQKGEQLADLGTLKAAGAGAFSDDGRPIMNAMIMRRALTYARMLGTPIFDHCEDLNLTADGVMHEGSVSLRLGLRGIPRSSEASMVARDCGLSHETGGHLHVCHVSNRDSIAAIRFWKDRGAPVTAEVSPHHLTLTDDAIAQGDGYDTSAKMKPPLCCEDDRRLLVEALEDGTIDCIATDHAPHAPATKDTLFNDAPFGIIGFESAFSVLYTAFVAPGRWRLDFLIEKMTSAPAKLMGAEWGTLKPGAAADLTLLEVGVERPFDLSSIRSRSRNSPWLGKAMLARPVGTLLEGNETFAHPALFPAGLSAARSLAPAAVS
ncbi:MAG: dihydroorotase [Planctomycetota bacterium]|nr:dihydroorotase [Planctomycetota bacterium]